jgi:hypothetical protein
MTTIVLRGSLSSFLGAAGASTSSSSLVRTTGGTAATIEREKVKV